MSLIQPHGGVLVNREADGAERESLLRAAEALPTVTINARAEADLELIATGALLRRLQGIIFGPVSGPTTPVRGSYVPLCLHLALVLLAGIYLPAPLVRWFEHVARLLG